MVFELIFFLVEFLNILEFRLYFGSKAQLVISNSDNRFQFEGFVKTDYEAISNFALSRYGKKIQVEKVS
jgi:hypothetical protein